MIYQDEYRDWAQDYDEFGEIDQANEAERDFLDHVLSSCGVKDVLDCACGTGQHLIMLSHLGFHLSGSDFSPAMLEACRRNLDRFDLFVPTAECDYRSLENVWEQKFDAVLCLTQALNHMLTREDLLKALLSMKERLRDDGVLIITQGTTHRTLGDEYRFSLVVNKPDFTRLFVRDIEEHFQSIHIMDIFHSADHNEMKQHDIRIRIILDDEYLSLMKEAGFSRVELFGGYDRSPYDREHSWKMIVVARP
jgi:SAM-dependent methyltransferase